MAKNKKIENRFFGRRQFLIGTGNFMLTLPPLISMMPSKAMAQVLQPRVRVFTGVGVFGIDYHQLFPSDQQPVNATAGGIYHQDLSNMQKNISRILDFNNNNLAGLESKTNLYRGLGLIDGTYAGHNHSVLSGTKSGGRAPIYGKSIDVIIEQALGVSAARVKTVNSTFGKAEQFSFDRDNSGNRKISSLTFGDQNLFNQLFPGGSQPQPPGNGPSKEKMIVDKVITDLQNLMSHNRLSQNDKNTLSDYVDGVNDLQKRIIAANNPNQPACSTPNINFHVPPRASNVGSMNTLYDNYFDIMVMAAQCDNARVFHIANTAINDTINNGANNYLHHGAVGGSNGSADAHGWFLQRMARLAKKLDAVVDPFDSNGKTLLDNSIVFWTNELASWTAAHSVTSMPAITFGSGGGYLRTGSYIDYRQRPFLTAKNKSAHRHLGYPYKQLLISIMRAAGLQRSQYINIGDGNGFGEFTPNLLKSDAAARTYYSRFNNTHNDPLPFVSLGG